MSCIAASAKTWRQRVLGWDDVMCSKELKRAWFMRPHASTTNKWVLQDWAQFRAATLREARKRGLDLSVVELGT